MPPAQVPFSAVYWLGYEQLKSQITARLGSASHFGWAWVFCCTPIEPSKGFGKACCQSTLTSGAPFARHVTGAADANDMRYTFKVSFAAGAVSGAFAAALTTPFDVIKTRQQAFLFGGSRAGSGAVPSTLATGRQV
eukprot:COSAG01_NODE_8904_length_2621_cov_1.521412_3_plen_136_part_00